MFSHDYHDFKQKTGGSFADENRVSSIFQRVKDRGNRAVFLETLRPVAHARLFKKQQIKVPEMEILTPAEQQWLAQVEEIAREALDKQQLSVQKVADEMSMSVRHLRRRIKKATGIHPSEYLREMRLQRARHLLEKRSFRTVTEVAHATGFSTPEYFSKIYAKRFGVLPSVVLQSAKKASA